MVKHKAWATTIVVYTGRVSDHKRTGEAKFQSDSEFGPDGPWPGTDPAQEGPGHGPAGRARAAARRRAGRRPGETVPRNDPRPETRRVGRGAGALGARGAEKRRPLLGRGALQTVGCAEIQNRHSASGSRTAFMSSFKIGTN